MKTIASAMIVCTAMVKGCVFAEVIGWVAFWLTLLFDPSVGFTLNKLGRRARVM